LPSEEDRLLGRLERALARCGLTEFGSALKGRFDKLDQEEEHV
jgi:hypothetical protein